MRRRWTTSPQELPSSAIFSWSLGHSKLYTPKERTSLQMLPRRGEEDMDIVMVNELTSIVPVPVNNLGEIRAETAKDPIFMKIMEYVMQGWPDNRSKVSKEVQPYWINHMEIAVEDGILLKMNRIIIPPWLRPSTLSKIHEGHQGIEKNFFMARDAVFWPGMKHEITQLVECCEICQSNAQSQKWPPI